MLNSKIVRAKPNFFQSYIIIAAFLAGIYSGNYINGDSSISEESVQACFVPGQNCTQKIVAEIDKAEHTILVQAFAFTSKPIIYALLRAHNRGVKVKILLDKSNIYMKKNDALDILKDIKDIKIDIVSGIAHNKIIIVDSNMLITGSFNFSHAANHKNTENLLLINSSSLISSYKANWNARDKQSYDVETARLRCGKPQARVFA